MIDKDFNENLMKVLESFKGEKGTVKLSPEITRMMIEAAEAYLQHEQNFDLRWEADMRAIKRWQSVDPEKRKLTWPDHTDLCVWLLDQIAWEPQ